MLYPTLIKPLFDRIFALFFLIAGLPVFLIVVIFLAIANRGKIWFIQKRIGRGEKVFSLIKFRTMNDRTDSNGQLLPDGTRLTPVGKFLRKTSLDEIPQVINILRGEMSFVGPRPLLVEYLPLYNERQRRRHEVMSGVTGWAQVNGRNAISWQTKFELDVWYVENQSFLLDIRIIFLTVIKIFKAEGINSLGSATIERFNGN